MRHNLQCSSHRRLPACSAFTLIELMVVLAIAAVLATMVLPMMRNDDRLRLIAITSLIRSDLEYAQALSISQPSTPLLVKFDADAGQYHVARYSAIDTPIVREDTGMPYLVTLGVGRAASGAGLTLDIEGMVADCLLYDTHGGLLDFSNTPVITLQSATEWFKLAIEPTTGTITETRGTGEAP
jgi:prepilin-type N-terminal cleavage/methylation domain-containing protein